MVTALMLDTLTLVSVIWVTRETTVPSITMNVYRIPVIMVHVMINSTVIHAPAKVATMVCTAILTPMSAVRIHSADMATAWIA